MADPIETPVQRYIFASISCMTASAVTNPVDVTKIRMQLEGELQREKGQLTTTYKGRYYKGIIRGMFRIAHDEGIRGLYKGITPALIRECVYSGIRIGAYEPMKVLFGATDPAHTAVYKKLAAGASSGAIGSSVAVPADLIRVRLQAQGRFLPGHSHQYEGFMHAFIDIIKKEGLIGLYRGTTPTVQRAMVVTATQVTTYDHTKHTILNHGWMDEGPKLHILSSMIAGFMTALTSSPVDVVKTRVMNQKISGLSKDERLYKNSLDCLIKLLKSEGIFGLYKGFIPNWMRIGPHTVISFFLFEYLRKVAGIRPV
ncbi:mitochondrial substrate carrier family protein ucpB-like [Amphiura filiformis]|uniref:mitochondrial substrate carrier family protein ucpB-like n=1 Tax=Amphiura filiformis TaxID=82378 RepID=UPI003B21243D